MAPRDLREPSTFKYLISHDCDGEHPSSGVREECIDQLVRNTHRLDDTTCWKVLEKDNDSPPVVIFQYVAFSERSNYGSLLRRISIVETALMVAILPVTSPVMTVGVLKTLRRQWNSSAHWGLSTLVLLTWRRNCLCIPSVPLTVSAGRSYRYLDLD
jgi:hypothetical protein